MKLHNTLTRSVDEFTPGADNTVTMYSCGPTVYDNPHIGNWASYIRWDILARNLKRRYGLQWYMNITDVGHLVSDADDGQDKLEKGAQREGKTAWEVAEHYTNVFVEGLRWLNISIYNDHLVKATDHIPEQIKLIQVLEEKGHTYVIDDGVYFDSTTFPTYGEMARLDIEGLQAGARVELGQKRNASDFALWKFTPEGQQRDMEWDSPWGIGFPGWHIECSAMAMRYLGNTIDIHTGGIDHIPVHHTNEIAQSEAATGSEYVRFWLHSNFLQIDGTKISKSLGNTYTLHDLFDKGYDGNHFRMLILQSHFQTEANFTWESIDGAKNRYKELMNFAERRFQLHNDGVNINDIIFAAEFDIKSALDDNLNTPKVLATISSFISKVDGINIAAESFEAFDQLLRTFDNLLGFMLRVTTSDITDEQKSLIQQRLTAREQKDWILSDSIRDQLVAAGIGLKDTPHGTIWYSL